MKLSLPTKKDKGETQTPKTSKSLKKWLKPLRNVVILAVIAGGGYYAWSHFFAQAGVDTGEITYTTEAVSTQTIIKSITSSGTLTAANSYTVNTLVEGEILWAEFEEGDMVEEDQALFQIDDSDVANTLEKAEISLAQAQRSYDSVVDRQYLYSDYAGTVYEVEVEVGDTIKSGDTIATLQDRTSLTVELPFSDDDADTFYVGQAATVTLQNTFETLDATVEEIASYTSVLTGNRIVRVVTLSVPNNGGLSAGMIGTATVGNCASADSGTFEERDIDTIVAENAGDVTAIYIDEGDAVWKNMLVLTLGGDDMEDDLLSASESLRTTEISYESSQDALDNYNITSPISGTVIDKGAKQGETVESGDTLCIIYDLSYLEMTMSIDELDISMLSVGQDVLITPDSFPDDVYTGTITKVSVVGSTLGGTTTYPVTVQVDDMADLLPGMNVSAEIVVSQVTDVVAVSNAMISRGNVVLVTDDSPSAVNAVEMPTMEAPEGYVYVPVEIGLSNDDYTEITAGLQIGDTVATANIVAVAAADTSMMMPGMDAGMSSGPSSGMPSGGPSSSGMQGGMR